MEHQEQDTPTADEKHRMSPEIRYDRDPQFHALVDMLRQFIYACEYTPTELREAVILASIQYELHTVRSFLVRRDDVGGGARLMMLHDELKNQRFSSNRVVGIEPLD